MEHSKPHHRETKQELKQENAELKLSEDAIIEANNENFAALRDAYARIEKLEAKLLRIRDALQTVRSELET